MKGYLTPELRKRIVEYIRVGWTALEAIRVIGVPKQTYYDWRKRYPDFAAELAEAAAEGVEAHKRRVATRKAIKAANKELAKLGGWISEDEVASRAWLKDALPIVREEHLKQGVPWNDEPKREE